MGKGKNPRKHRDPDKDANVSGKAEPERQTQEKAALVPPSRRPPTAIGAETPPPPPPPREPPRSSGAPIPEPNRPVLFQLLQGIRKAVGAVLDVADAAADAIIDGLERRA